MSNIANNENISLHQYYQTDIIVKYKLCIFSLILDKFLYGNMTDGMDTCKLWNCSNMRFNRGFEIYQL